MRVYYENSKDLLIVEGSADIYSPLSLQYSISNGVVSIFLLENQKRILNLLWTEIQNALGIGFSSQAQLEDYLDIEFSKKPDFAQVINDSSISTQQTYSSVKIEDRIDEEVGEEDFNFSVIFRNQLSR